MKRTMILLILTLLLPFSTGFIRTASADYYEETEVRLEVRGTGSFTMEEEGKPENIQTIRAEGQGYFLCSFREPGSYRFRIFSNDPELTDRYIADISVYQSTRADNELYAVVSVMNEADSMKENRSVIEYTQAPDSALTDTTAEVRTAAGSSVRTGDSSLIRQASSLFAVCAVLTAIIFRAGLRRRA